MHPRHFVALLARARPDGRPRALVEPLPVLGQTGMLRSRGCGLAAELAAHVGWSTPGR